MTSPALVWAPPLAWMALIFFGSSTPGGELPGFLSLLHLDKVAHFAEYAVLGLLTARAFARWPRLDAAVLVAACAAFAFAFGITDEIHQRFVPERTSSAFDLVPDLLGGTVGAWVWLTARRSGRAPLWW